MFFFISWGSKGVRLLFGDPEAHHCEICQQERSFRKMVIYKVWHLWWVFRWVTDKSYALICQVCRNGHRIDTKATEAAIGKSPIPFMDRLGWTGGLGLVGLLFGGVAVAGVVHGGETNERLARPAVGDVYEVDLARMEKTPESSTMYSALLVTRVSPDGVDVRLPKQYFSAQSGVTSHITDGSAMKPDFYADDGLHISRAGLARLHADGTLTSVDR